MTRLVATVLLRDLPALAAILTDPPAGTSYVELRLDTLPDPTPRAVESVLALMRTVPVIATCRPAGQGGHFDGDEPSRLDLLRAAAEAGADLVDVEDTALEALPDGLPGERLASCHLARFVPRLEGLARRLAAHGTRFAKLAVPARTPVQLAELLDLQEAMGDHFTVSPTGPLAEAGRVMAAARGAAFCYGAAHADGRGHPDQPLVRRLHDTYHVEVVNHATRFFAVVGDPIAHSFSPAYHSAIFRHSGIDARLVPLPMRTLQPVMAMADSLHIDGLAVTHPLKAEAVELAAAVLPGARTVGAANTMMRAPGGWQGRNTDWKAACELLPRLLKSWRRSHEGERPRVLLLGSGGGARAMAVALFEEEVDVAIWSRDFDHAEDLAEELIGTIEAVAIEEPAEFPADLVINATPLGMAGVQAAVELDGSIFRPGGYAIDLAYGSPDSIFRRLAREAGVQMTTGEDFFFLQARRQAELFTNGGIARELHEMAIAACRAAC